MQHGLNGERDWDLAIDAVVALHEKIPEVTLDIYGQGMLWQEIEEKIKQLNAQNYIHLKGHQDLQTRFKAYDFIWPLPSGKRLG